MNRVLLDTHAVLWWLGDDPALSAAARTTIADPTNEILVSVASIWEIAIKRSLGKLEAPDNLPEVIESEPFDLLAIEPAHVWAVGELPPHHGDPFDRLLVAQALSERLAIVSADARLAAYGVEVRW